MAERESPPGAQFSERIRECPACDSPTGQGVLRYPSKVPQWRDLSIFVCTECGFGYVPAVHFDLGAYYEQEYGSDHQNRDRLPSPADFFGTIDDSTRPFVQRARKHNELLERFRDEFDTILEHGPGPGAFLHYRSARRKLAIELDEVSFPYLDYLGVERMAPDDVRGLEGQLDLVAASHFVEHLLWHEVDRFLAECAGLLRPGGLLLVEVPEWGHVYRHKLPRRGGHEPHTLFFSPQALLRCVRRTGLRPLHMQTRKRVFDVDDKGRVSLKSYRDNVDRRAAQLCCILRKDPPAG